MQTEYPLIELPGTSNLASGKVRLPLKSRVVSFLAARPASTNPFFFISFSLVPPLSFSTLVRVEPRVLPFNTDANRQNYEKNGSDFFFSSISDIRHGQIVIPIKIIF